MEPIETVANPSKPRPLIVMVGVVPWGIERGDTLWSVSVGTVCVGAGRVDGVVATGTGGVVGCAGGAVGCAGGCAGSGP